MAIKQQIPGEPKHNQHRIPRFYLKGFLPDPRKSEIWVYKEGQEWNPGWHSTKYNPCLTGLDKTASERDAYAFVTFQGQRDFNTVENWLRDEEEKAKPILEKLRTRHSISNSEKELFAEYIQVTLRRTSERDRRMRTLPDGVVENSLLHSMSLKLAKAGDFRASRMVSKIQEHSESADGKKWLLELSRVAIIPQLHSELVGMKWRFFVAPRDTFFVTSNFPVIFERLAHRQSMLIFPIGSNVVLFAGPNLLPDLQFVEASSDEVLAINFAFIRQTSIASPCEIYAAYADGQVWGIFGHSIGLNENQQRVLMQLFV